ncbi:MAG: hypothetical protein HFK09_05350 [Clostridia bacterium]|nr:hypothetical protein [Clostridia bacterium]
MEEKKTRGNKKILVVLAMLFLLVAIFAIGGYTFAKYISSQSTGTQQATVAKWGYVVTVDTTNLFGDKYEADTNNVSTVTATGTTLSIAAKTAGNKVVAPSGKGSMTITITGMAEVAAQLTYTADSSVTTSDIKLTRAESGTVGDDAYVAPVDYRPVKWSITKGTDAIQYTDAADSNKKDATATTLENCLKALSEQCGNVLEANDETYKDGVTFTLSWEWAFHTDDASDKFDTILGYAAEGKTGDILEGCTAVTNIEFGFSIGIAQIATRS